MHTTPPTETVPQIDTFDPIDSTETLARLLVGLEALTWATSQVLGSPNDSRARERLHVLVGFTADLAETALDEADEILLRLNEYMQARNAGEGV
jgi:hypothetical protein